MAAERRSPYDPRDSWIPAGTLFLVALVLVVDDARPGGVLGGGLWIPVLYAVAPVGCGLLAYVRTRAASGRPLRPAVLVAAAVWGVIGALAALVVVIVVGLGRPPADPPSTVSTLSRGLVTFLVPTAGFVGCYGEAGRRPRVAAALLVVAAPVAVTGVLGSIVWIAT